MMKECQCETEKERNITNFGETCVFWPNILAKIEQKRMMESIECRGWVDNRAWVRTFGCFRQERDSNAYFAYVGLAFRGLFAG